MHRKRVALAAFSMAAASMVFGMPAAYAVSPSQTAGDDRFRW